MRRKLRGNVLCLIGLLLIIAGVTGLLSGPEASQYAAYPPEGDLLQPLAKMETAWEEMARPVSIHETTGGVSLTAGEKSQGDVNLYQVGGYSRMRIFSSGVLKRGAAKMISES